MWLTDLSLIYKSLRGKGIILLLGMVQYQYVAILTTSCFLQWCGWYYNILLYLNVDFTYSLNINL